MATLGEVESWPQVRTVMTRNALTVRPETPIRFATGLMIANRLTTLPVVDAEHHLVGLVTDADVIADVLDRSRGSAVRPGSGTVADLMHPPIVTVDDGSSVAEAAITLAHSKLSRLVVTHAGHVVGTIGRIEVLEALLDRVGRVGDEGAASIATAPEVTVSVPGEV